MGGCWTSRETSGCSRPTRYLDSSAYVKLPLGEPEAEALREELGRWEGYVSSALIRVEAARACARYGAEYEGAAISGLESLALLPLDDQVLERAAGPAPSDLRSLDALHLATALAIADDLGVVLCYDARLAAAARGHGLASPA